jgi:hypothetical protein
MQIGVADAGIASNQLLRDGVGPGGVSQVILEGVNDLGIPYAQHRPLPAFEELIGGYRPMVAEARAQGVKVILGTLLPFKGAKYWSDQKWWSAAARRPSKRYGGANL